MTRALRAIVAGGAVTAALLLAVAPHAAAHAGFVSSDPADGQRLASAPDAITIRFTEPPDPAISQVTVVDGAGQPVEVGTVELVGNDGLRAPLPSDLPDGGYTVTWFAVSTVDGHLTTDAFAFGVGDAAEVPAEVSGPSSPDPTAAGIGGRATLYVGLSLLVAAAVVGGVAFSMAPRALRIVTAGGGALALAGALLLLASEVDLIGTSTRAFLASDTGAPVVTLLIAVAIAAALAVLAAARPHRVTLGLAGIAAVVAWWARASSGHADGLAQELAQTVHMTAAGTWIGGLVLLALLLRERRSAGLDPPVAEARRFSTIALVAVLVVVATGSIRALQETGGLGAFRQTLETGYGQMLAVKIGLAFALIALGAVNRWRTIPRIADGDPAPVGRVVRAELVVALGVVLLTGTLTGLPPGGVDRSEASPPATIGAEASDFGTTVRVRLTATPGSPGPNTFTADVTDYDTGGPADVDAVSLRLARVGEGGAPTATIELAAEGDSWVADHAGLSIAGTWNVTVLITVDPDTVEVPMTLTTRVPGATTSVAEVPGQPSITSVTYVDGRSAQLYVDPGSAGPNQVHVTVFDAAGRELQLDEATLTVVPPSEPARTADVLRFGPGHFVANIDLGGGTWIFDFTAVPVDGAPLQATLRADVGEPS